MKPFLQMFALAVAAVTVAEAGVVFTLDNPDQTGLPGNTLQFFGTITNTGTDTVSFNSDNFNFTGGASFSTTDLFFSNAPISLDGGLSSGDIELFDVSLTDPFTDSFGLYGGSESLIGGANGDSQDVLASADFSVTAQAPDSTTPEPASFIMAGAGVLALALKARRRKHISSAAND
jgi:hypothetical protein